MTNTPNPRPDHSRATTRKRLAVVAGVITAAIAAAVGAPVATAALRGDVSATSAPRIVRVETAPDLGGLTIDELAGELAEAGLQLEITPAQASSGWDDAVDGGADGVDDPFAGMSDAEIDALSDDEYFGLLDDAGWTHDDGDDDDGNIGDGDVYIENGDGNIDDDWDGAEDSETPVAGFRIAGDEIDTSAASPDVADQARSIWERFAELVPADQRTMVTGFELLDEAYGGAHVYPTDADPTKWVLGVATGLGADLDLVLVHEFGHLLTLQAEEVPPGGDPDSCPTYHTGEGCALTGSTFAGFVDRFWPPTMVEEINRIQEAGNWDAIDAFYDKNKDSFVTDYATTNPAEDLAETFAVFVMNDRPAGTTVADQKVEFLWDDPDLVALRTEIRTRGDIR